MAKFQVLFVFAFAIALVLGKSNRVDHCNAMGLAYGLPAGYVPYDFYQAAYDQIVYYQTVGDTFEPFVPRKKDQIAAQPGFQLIEGYVPFNNGHNPNQGFSPDRVVVEVATDASRACRSVYYSNSHYGKNGYDPNGPPAFYGPCACPMGVIIAV